MITRLKVGQRYYQMFRGRFRVYEVEHQVFGEDGRCQGGSARPIFSLDTYDESKAKRNVYEHNGWTHTSPRENRGQVVVTYYVNGRRIVRNTYAHSEEEARKVAVEQGYQDGKWIKFWTV